MQRQKSFFLQGVTGVDHPSAKRYRKLNDRVKGAVAAYGRAEILVYTFVLLHVCHMIKTVY